MILSNDSMHNLSYVLLLIFVLKYKAFSVPPHLFFFDVITFCGPLFSTIVLLLRAVNWGQISSSVAFVSVSLETIETDTAIIKRDLDENKKSWRDSVRQGIVW